MIIYCVNFQTLLSSERDGQSSDSLQTIPDGGSGADRRRAQSGVSLPGRVLPSAESAQPSMPVCQQMRPLATGKLVIRYNVLRTVNREENMFPDSKANYIKINVLSSVLSLCLSVSILYSLCKHITSMLST